MPSEPPCRDSERLRRTFSSRPSPAEPNAMLRRWRSPYGGGRASDKTATRGRPTHQRLIRRPTYRHRAQRNPTHRRTSTSREPGSTPNGIIVSIWPVGSNNFGFNSRNPATNLLVSQGTVSVEGRQFRSTYSGGSTNRNYLDDGSQLNGTYQDYAGFHLNARCIVWRGEDEEVALGFEQRFEDGWYSTAS